MGYMGYRSRGGAFEVKVIMVQVLVITCLRGVYSRYTEYHLRYDLLYAPRRHVITDLFHREAIRSKDSSVW